MEFDLIDEVETGNGGGAGFSDGWQVADFLGEELFFGIDHGLGVEAAHAGEAENAIGGFDGGFLLADGGEEF